MQSATTITLVFTLLGYAPLIYARKCFKDEITFAIEIASELSLSLSRARTEGERNVVIQSLATAQVI